MKLDLIGKTFNRLTIISPCEKNSHGSLLYFCKCSCGKIIKLSGSRVKRGIVKSCGCLRSDISKVINLKHGMSRKTELSPEYSAWNNMKNRCYRKSDKRYVDYGGRGITVCEEWINSFLQFFNDMGKRPSIHHSIDRIDNFKGYSKENCRWATRSEQAKNTRKRKHCTSLEKGVSYNKSVGKWCSYKYVNGKKVHLGYFETEHDAIVQQYPIDPKDFE